MIFAHWGSTQVRTGKDCQGDGNRHMTDHNLVAATELAAKNPTSFPNESTEYREARNALSTEEIEPAVICGGSPNNDETFQQAGRSPRTTSSMARTGP